MRSRKSRLALLGVLALALTMVVGIASGSVAEAKKKKSKKGGTVTVSQTAPTTIPPGNPPNGNDSITTIPLTVGKKAKGKVVGWDSLTVTSTFSAPDNDTLGSLNAEITAPNGRTVGMVNPLASGFANNTTSGPLTETPDSPFFACFPVATNPCPGGAAQNPEATVPPPFNGTVGNQGLSFFGGVPAKGTWFVKVFNSSPKAATLDSVSISMNLKNAPV